MDTNALDTANSALIANRIWMDTISSNIANANTTHDVNGQPNPYKRKVVDFQTILNSQNQSQGVQVSEIREDETQMRLIYEPDHPDADEQGYVHYPNITTEKEMVDLLNAKNSYEAATKTIQVYKAMFNSALGI